MCWRAAWVACVGVGRPPAAWRAAATLAMAVALWMRSAGSGGWGEEVEDVDEDEDEEKVLVLGDVGCTAMLAGAALWAAAASTAATVGRMEGMFSGRRLRAGRLGGPTVTCRPGGPIRPVALGGGGAGLRSQPSGLGCAGLLQCVRACELAAAGGKCSRRLHSGAGGVWREFLGVCAGAVCGSLGGVGVPWGVEFLAAGVRGLPVVGGGEGCSAGGSVAGVCGCLGGWGRPVLRGPGLHAMVGVCGPPGREWGGRARGRGCVGGCGAGFVCVVSVYVSACSGAPVWSLVGQAVWRRSLPSSAAAARISQMSVRIWCTSWSVVGRGYCSGGLRFMRRRTLLIARYPQVRGRFGLGGASVRVSGPALTCVWALGMAQIQGTVPVDGQRRLIHWVRQSMAKPRW